MSTLLLPRRKELEKLLQQSHKRVIRKRKSLFGRAVKEQFFGKKGRGKKAGKMCPLQTHAAFFKSLFGIINPVNSETVFFRKEQVLEQVLSSPGQSLWQHRCHHRRTAAGRTSQVCIRPWTRVPRQPEHTPLCPGAPTMGHPRADLSKPQATS